MSLLFVISAPSGAGKTTLCQRLLGDFPNINLSVSTTTRAPRGNEQHGVDYFFVSRPEFEKMIAADQFAEWAIVHGNYYGTSKAVIESAISKNQSVLLDIDVQGADSIAKKYPESLVKIFISPPDLASLESRLRARATDNEETIQKRLRNAKAELDWMSEFDHVIVNDQLDRAYAELKELVQSKLSEKKNG